MNAGRLVGVSTWGIAAAGAVVAVWSATAPMAPGAPAAAGGRVSSPFSPPPAYATESLRNVAVAKDLFRSDRRPATTVYDPVRLAAPAVRSTVSPRPTLMLTGIIGGTSPAAVVEGMPGADGPRVLHAGDTVGALKVVRIMAHGVVIVGMDTTWTLTLRNPWP